MSRKRKKVLLVNPWIYDFAAYDFWIKPLGLLSIGGVLETLNYDVYLLDCLDRHHPVVQNKNTERHTISKRDGTGKFVREELPKPDVLCEIPRKYCRYGLPMDIVEKILSDYPEPDVILMTSYMTYWYPAVRDMVIVLRQQYPGVPIILGGIYATLCPEHALVTTGVDHLIRGEGESKAVQLVARLCEGSGHDIDFCTLDDLPFPAYDLYPNLRSVAIATSRGCPLRCSFCASHMLSKGYRRRSVQNVVAELHHWHRRTEVKHVAFYDDALLFEANRYCKPILRAIVDASWPVHFHTPNGVHPRFIDGEVAELFRNVGVLTIRLSFESSSEARQKAMSKVLGEDIEDSLCHLEQAGYDRQDIGVYIIAGLPDQTIEEVRDSAHFVHDLGARISLASFSPIWGTRDWQKCIAMGYLNNNDDLLLTNNSLFPIWMRKYGWGACEEVKLSIKDLNSKLSD